MSMLSGTIKFALRRLFKEANYTLINLTGITVGVTFSFLIFLYLSDQLSYEDHIPNADQIYRVASDFTINGYSDVFSNTPRPMGQALVEEFPGILISTKIMGFGGLQNHAGFLRKGEEYIKSNHLYVSDSNFFKIFDLPMIAGDHKALNAPNSMVVSESVAEKLFGTANAMGQQITLENNQTVQVTGIIQDHNRPTYIPFEVIISYSTFYSSGEYERSWYGAHVFTYVKTSNTFSPEEVYQNWTPFFNKYMKPTFDILNGYAEIKLQPLKGIYFEPEYIWEPYPHNSKQNIYIFFIIGFVLMLVAGFNYMNLSISQSYYRHKEMSIRKILGSGKKLLIQQHLIASGILSLFAGLLSISLLSTLFPIFTQLTDRINPVSFWEQPGLLIVVLVMSLICGLVPSIYPAIYESDFQPMDIKKPLKNEKNILIRKVFVVSQQVISIALIICTLVVIDQINFAKNRDLGFEKDNLAIIQIKDPELLKNIEVLGENVERLSGVQAVSMVDGSFKTGVNEFTFHMQHADGGYVATPSQTITTGLNFVNTMKIDLLAGRTFQKEDEDYVGVIINQFLANKMGYTPQTAIGVRFNFGGEIDVERKVIGVVDNFLIGSAQEELQAMTLGMEMVSRRHLLLVRLHEQNQQETLAQIKSLWIDHGSTFPFSYSMMNDEFNELLIREDNLFDLLILASFTILFISCLGLFGLASHSAAQRTKEIGIRKVVGASNIELFYTMINGFLRSYLIAFLIGSVTAWYFGSSWLNGYAYRVNFDWSNILIGGVISLVILVATLSIHILKVIYANPVESLRYE